MRATRPKGVSIFRYTKMKDRPFGCIVKSKGRTGAGIRSRLARLSAKQQQPILQAWASGGIAELPD